ncbi:MAG: hypothetical protein NT169_05065 [Chloroflexi bacterium]|nr:hypothetical protein [Chloroflexota bacterium]
MAIAFNPFVVGLVKTCQALGVDIAVGVGVGVPVGVGVGVWEAVDVAVGVMGITRILYSEE